MTPKEADIILLEALLQTPNSRADYFRIKATKGNHNPVTFYLDLSEAYKRIEEYVNSFDYQAWWYDENGKQVFPKQYLFLPNYTSGRMIGNLGSENLIELLEPLHEFGESLKTIIESKIQTLNQMPETELIIQCDEKPCSPETCPKPDLKNNFFDFQVELFEIQKSYCTAKELQDHISERKKHFRKELEEFYPHKKPGNIANCHYNQTLWLLDFFKVEEEKLDKPERSVSFSWIGSQDQKEALCEALKGAGYIHLDTSNEAFTAIFSGCDIDVNFHRVIWIKKNNKNTVNKTVLREFLTLLLGKFQEKTVSFCFMDIKRKPISLNKPKKNEPSNCYMELEKIINRVKK